MWYFMGDSKSARATGLIIDYWPVERLKPYGKNPRVIPQSAIDKVARSIKEFGWRQPIVVDKKGVIIVGHTRFGAALQLGLKEVPVHVASMSAAKARAYRLADNRTGEESSWDADILRVELDDLGAAFDVSITGFDDAELADLIGGEDLVGDLAGEWQGMPEYVSEDKTAFRSLIVHFKDQKAVDQFASTVGQKITGATKMLWFPEIEIESAVGKRYDSVS